MATIAPVRPSPIAGAWYEGDPQALARAVDAYLDQAELLGLLQRPADLGFGKEQVPLPGHLEQRPAAGGPNTQPLISKPRPLSSVVWRLSAAICLLALLLGGWAWWRHQAAPAAAPAPARKTEIKANKTITIGMFLVIIAITMSVVVWAARRTKTAADFYAAGGGITGTQNGWAIAGDYMSAASFLGISGMISLYGYDGFTLSPSGARADRLTLR